MTSSTHITIRRTGLVLATAVLGAVLAGSALAGNGSQLNLPPQAAISLTTVTGVTEPLLMAGFTGIDADSSPLRFRGCFRTPMSLAMLSESYVVYPDPTPLNAPSWFSCFDSGRLTDDIASGSAVAFLSERNIAPGVDRVVAVYADGRAYAWQQLNDSAEN